VGAFGVVPELAFALLGHGRCLLRLDRPIEAADVLHRAREIFDSLGAAPARSETDALCGRPLVEIPRLRSTWRR
jgi:hypothetical protein